MTQVVVKICTVSGTFEPLARETQKIAFLPKLNSTSFLEPICARVISQLKARPLEKNELRSISLELTSLFTGQVAFGKTSNLASDSQSSETLPTFCLEALEANPDAARPRVCEERESESQRKIDAFLNTAQLNLQDRLNFGLQNMVARISCWQTEPNSLVAAIEVVCIDPIAFKKETTTLTTIEAARQLLHELAQPVQALYAFSGLLEDKLGSCQQVPTEKIKRWSGAIHEQATRLVKAIADNRNLYCLPKDKCEGSFITKENLHEIISVALENFRFLTEGIDLIIKCRPFSQGLPEISKSHDPYQKFSVSFVTHFVFFYVALLIANSKKLLVKEIEIRVSNAVHFPLPFLPIEVAQLEAQHFDPEKFDQGLSIHIMKRLSLKNTGKDLGISDNSPPEILLAV